jgi:hypothetical protein
MSIPGPFCEAENDRLDLRSRRGAEVFATEDAARAWIEENDPEGVAFEYTVIE